MKMLKRQWETFKAKSLWGKFTDLLFVGFIVMVLLPDGRIFFQRAILATGLFSRLDVNTEEALSPAELNMALVDADGQALTLADFVDRPVFLNYWATWCPPCNAEMPSIIDAMQALEDEVHFVLVTAEDPAVVEPFLVRKAWDIPVYYLASQPQGALQYNSLPTSLVINGRGIVIHRSEGMRNWSSDAMLELLKE